jgi:hypothetical protein
MSMKEFTNAESFKLCTQGLQQLQLKRYEESEKLLFEATQKYPDDMPPNFYFGVILAINEKYDSALVQFKKVAESNSVFVAGAKQNIDMLTKGLAELSEEE